jgi:hypothetical protein
MNRTPEITRLVSRLFAFLVEFFDRSFRFIFTLVERFFRSFKRVERLSDDFFNGLSAFGHRI